MDSFSEQATRTEDGWREGSREEVLGRVLRVHRLGKGLSFVHLEVGAADPLIVTFEAATYDPQPEISIPFPAARSAAGKLQGERLRVVTEMQFRQHIQRWLRCVLRAAVEGTETPNVSAPAEAALHGRRKGVAACAGWVRCPLCSNQRSFNRGAGLRQHLMTVHQQEAMVGGDWLEKMAQLADSQGIYPTRGGSAMRTATSRVHSSDVQSQGTNLVLPGLVAARDGDVSTLQQLLLQGWRPLGPGQQDRHGSSAVDWAAGNGHLECVKLLLPYTDGLQLCRRDGRGPLHWACRHGRLDMARFLLQQHLGGAEQRAADGTTPLMLACFGGHTEVADYLLSARADLAAQNSYDCDAGHFAALGGSVAACAFLLEKGLSLTRPQSSGHTALHKAAERGQLPLAKWLVKTCDVELLRGECPSTCAAERWSDAHLPSALARRHGHEACAVELEELGL
eukprot:s2676_g10.t1